MLKIAISEVLQLRDRSKFTGYPGRGADFSEIIRGWRLFSKKNMGQRFLFEKNRGRRLFTIKFGYPRSHFIFEGHVGLSDLSVFIGV